MMLNSTRKLMFLRRINSLNSDFANLGKANCERCQGLKNTHHETANGQCAEACETWPKPKEHSILAEEI